MINKKSLWFLTLFSLILVLSIYYITMPSELLLTTGATNISQKTEKLEEKAPIMNIEESSILAALRLEADQQMSKEIDELESVLTNSKSSTDEKNNAYEKIKDLNANRSFEEKLEIQLKETYKLESFIKINGENINVIVKSNNHSHGLANNIIRTIQSNFENQKYITVKFQQ